MWCQNELQNYEDVDLEIWYREIQQKKQFRTLEEDGSKLASIRSWESHASWFWVSCHDNTKRERNFQNKASSSIILSLTDQVLRKVLKEKIVRGSWKKPSELYMENALLTQIYLNTQFFGFRIDENKSTEDSLDEFNKLILDLETQDIKMDDEVKAIILLKSLPKTLKQFKETVKYEDQQSP